MRTSGPLLRLSLYIQRLKHHYITPTTSIYNIARPHRNGPATEALIPIMGDELAIAPTRSLARDDEMHGNSVVNNAQFTYPPQKSSGGGHSLALPSVLSCVDAMAEEKKI